MLPVWPDPDGEVRGETFSPLHKLVPDAEKKDEKLYRLSLWSMRPGAVVQEKERLHAIAIGNVECHCSHFTEVKRLFSNIKTVSPIETLSPSSTINAFGFDCLSK